MKKIFLYLIVFFALIQLFRPKKNKSDVVAQNQITSVMKVPQDVQTLLKRSCNDCHSNNTQYLWYHEIAPMSWMVAYHIKEGKKHLNFDEFGTYNSRKRDRALEETSEVVESGEMPMKGYVAFHPETKMSPEGIQKIKDWVTSLNLKHE